MASPPAVHLIHGTVHDRRSVPLSGATVTLTHSSITPVLSITTDSKGIYVLNLGDLSSDWSAGQTITLKASKTFEGRKTIETTISGGPSQTLNFILEETSDFTFEVQTTNLNRFPLVQAMPVTYDGEKVTHINPLPVNTSSSDLWNSSTLFTSSGIPRDYNLEVLRDNVPGHVMVTVAGHNDGAGTTRVVVAPTLTTADIDQSGLHASAITVDVASTNTNDTSAGTGLRTLTIEGLDSAGDIQSETITLNGQTEVTSAKTYSAINGFIGLTAGANNTSAGDIWVGNGDFTSGVPATKYFVGEANHNHGLSAYYTVPTGKTLFIRNMTVTVVGSNKEIEITLETSTDNGNLWIIEDEISGTSGTNFSYPILSLHSITAGNHIRVRAEAAGSGSELTVLMACELVDD